MVVVQRWLLTQVWLYLREQTEILWTGTVNESQRKWLSAPALDVSHPDYRDGKDYMTMSYEERSLDTDIVEALPGHVVTGVRLRKLGGHINLEVRVSFNQQNNCLKRNACYFPCI
jgi:hypothetical protein